MSFLERWPLGFLVGLLLPGVACAKHEPPPARSNAPPPPKAVPPTSPSPSESAHRATHPAFSERSLERQRLVEHALKAEGIENERVLDALRRVPRHRFVPPQSRGEAYANRPLAIGYGQTISQPYIVAAMTEAARPAARDRCLEIGTGSGYQAAVLAELCDRVYSIEYLPEVAAFGAANLRELGYTPGKVELRVGDGYRGWPEVAPFQVILVTAAPEQVPQPLLDQLAIGGRLIVPVGPREGVQQLERWVRTSPDGPDAFSREILMGVRFVPFLGDGAPK